MNGVEGKVASEILKPAAGLIDALIGPKIAKLKKWAIDRDLRGNFSTETRLTSLLEKYLERTVKRASSLSTIVSPQGKVPLYSLYEPVNLFRSRQFNSTDLEDDEQFDINAEGKCYLIIDEAGMGKSTFSKHLCISIIEKTDNIPILFDLVDYDPNKNLVENIARDFDEIDCEFDRQLFKKILAEGKFFIILDGFDETPIDVQKAIGVEMRSFNEKKGRASIVVTSRPQEGLPNLTNAIEFKIQKLNQDQAVSIFSKYDALFNLTIGKKLHEEIEKIPSRFLETPLLVSLLYRTYGFNNSIAEKISVFYAEIYEALYKGHDLTKSGYVREKVCGLDIDNFRQLLRAFSFLYIAKAHDSKQNFDFILNLVESAQKYCAFPAINSRKFINDLLLAVPLLTREGTTLKFMHRSIAEYFAAEYIANMPKSVELLTAITSSAAREKFSATSEFLYELSPAVYREVIIEPLANLYLAQSGPEKDGSILQTNNFCDKWAISFWPYDEVVVDNDLEIPPAPVQTNTSIYMYGNLSGEHYVAVMGTSHFRKITKAAWAELTKKITSVEAGIDFRCINSDDNLAELCKIIEPRSWYTFESAEISQNVQLSVFEEFMSRNIMHWSAESQGSTDTIRVISRARCEEVIQALRDLRNAESSINDVLAIR